MFEARWIYKRRDEASAELVQGKVLRMRTYAAMNKTAKVGQTLLWNPTNLLHCLWSVCTVPEMRFIIYKCATVD